MGTNAWTCLTGGSCIAVPRTLSERVLVNQAASQESSPSKADLLTF